MESSDLSGESSSLAKEVESLRAMLEEKEEDITRAAEFGLRLMEMNKELENRLEKDTKEVTEQLDSLKQDNYSLQLKLNAEKTTSRGFSQELETMREHLEGNYQQKIQHLEQKHAGKVEELSRVNEELRAGLTQYEIMVNSQAAKNAAMEAIIASLREDTKRSSDCSSLEEEVSTLERTCANLVAEKEELQLLLLDQKGQLELLNSETISLKEQNRSLEEEVLDHSRQANEWFKALQESQNENMELQGQLEIMKVQQAEFGHCGQGNSLFGEVEDRRVEMERTLISIQVQHESLVKNYSTLKQQHRKIKAELSAMLCRYGTVSADAAHVRRLQCALSQRDGEIQMLTGRLQKAEKQQPSLGGLQKNYAEAFVHFGDKKEYIQCLEHQKTALESQISSVSRELELKRTQLLWESTKLTETEAKLYKTEQDKSKIANTLCKLRLQLQESKDKENEAKTQCKKLEQDNAFLKEQLKGGRRTRLSGSRETEAAPSRSKFASSSLRQDSALANVGKENEPGAGMAAVVVPKREPRKKINLLESLERELNQTGSSVAAISTLHPAKPIVNPTNECTKEKESINPANSHDRASIIDVQSTGENQQDGGGTEIAPSVTCLEVSGPQADGGSGEAVQREVPAVAPMKVIRVGKDNPNQCNQQ